MSHKIHLLFLTATLQLASDAPAAAQGGFIPPASQQLVDSILARVSGPKQ